MLKPNITDIYIERDYGTLFALSSVGIISFVSILIYSVKKKKFIAIF